MSRRQKLFWLISLSTLLGLGGVGALLIYFIDKQCPLSVIQQGHNIFLQLGVGLSFGALSTIFIMQIMKHKKMQTEYEKYCGLIRPFAFTKLEIIFLSFCAGFGEEMLFRAFIQGHWGIWWTSLFFVAIHGYLNPWNRIFFYGVFMTFDIAAIGWMYEYFGFWSAASAHFMIDLILLTKMSKPLEVMEGLELDDVD